MNRSGRLEEYDYEFKGLYWFFLPDRDNPEWNTSLMPVLRPVPHLEYVFRFSAVYENLGEYHTWILVDAVKGEVMRA